MPKRKAENGFTLIELMVAMTLSLLAMSAIYSAYISQQKAYDIQLDVVEIQQNIRSAMFFITREIRQAGYDPYATSGSGIVTAAASAITFTFVADDDGTNNDGDTKVDETGELSTVQYQLFDANADGDMDLGRDVDGGGWQAVADNIGAIEFWYTLDDGTQNVNVAAGDTDEIRTIQLTVLANSGKADTRYTNTETYVPPSGAAWGPYNDGFRRRMLTTTIKCRNVGL